VIVNKERKYIKFGEIVFHKSEEKRCKKKMKIMLKKERMSIRTQIVGEVPKGLYLDLIYTSSNNCCETGIDRWFRCAVTRLRRICTIHGAYAARG
jgi:hypothetical protein